MGLFNFLKRRELPNPDRGLSRKLMEAKKEALNKLNIISLLQDGRVVYIPVGCEWTQDDMFQGVLMREVGFYHDPNPRESDSIMVDIEAGSVVQMHAHENTENIIICKGRAICTFADREVEIFPGPGTSHLAIPPHTVHSWKFLTRTQLFVMWQPPFNRTADFCK